MKIGVFGTGMVGRALAARFVELGHTVVMGTRDPAVTRSRKMGEGGNNSPFSGWLEQNPKIGLEPFAEAASQAEIIVNATNGSGSLEALNSAGAENMDGKILMDIANPLDFSRGMPPSLTISNTDSLGEQIQRAFPRVKVVKTLNTVTAALMARPDLVAEGEHSLFVSGNDAGAKEAVKELLRSLGWKDIIDLGDISSARGPEMYLPLWLRLWGALGTGMFNIRVVR